MQRPEDHPPKAANSSRAAMSIRRSLAADESSNMLEVLRGDDGVHRAPTPLNIRVRDLGRTIKERGEVCQWMSNITLPHYATDKTQPTPAGGAQTGKSTPNPAELVQKVSEAFDETHNAASRVVASEDVAAPVSSTGGTGDCEYVKAVSYPAPVPAPAPIDASNKSPVASGADPALTVVVGAGETETHTGGGEEPSFEEQLTVIRQQQTQLLERQRCIQEKLDRKLGGSSAGSSRTVIEQKPRPEVQPERVESEDIEPADQKAAKMEIKRRRLKGSLASEYARRDEGTVGDLLWSSTACSTTPFSASTSSSGTHVSAGRQANLRQDSSISISQLLSQTSCLDSQSFDDSESSEVVSKTRAM